MKEELKKIISSALSDIKETQNEVELSVVKARYLGKKSRLNGLLTSLKDIAVDQRKETGQLLNKIKIELEEAITNKANSYNHDFHYSFDETKPHNKEIGSLHPVTIIAKEVTDILKRMGFTIVSGPEMESEYYNFEALNIPQNHPARDMQDTYWLDNGLLLRTHTSPNQIRALKKYGVPIRICAPGRCFRNEDLDASHENTFFQLEGMVVDKNISINNLIYVMKELLKAVFKQEVKVRLRPGFFPFVEPGFELDCNCLICGGKGCPTCKNSGWIELCPCGMVHPNVLEECGVDSKIYSGFALGMGLTRLAMMKYKVDDIRVMNQGDIRKLKDFNIE